MTKPPHAHCNIGAADRLPSAAKLALIVLSLLSLAGAAGDSVRGAGETEHLGELPGQAPDAQAPLAPGQSVTPPHELTLAGGEVTVTYPPYLALAVTPEQLQTHSSIPACSQPFDYCFFLPASGSADTNLSAAGLRISRRPDLTAEMSCLVAQPGGWQELQPGILRLTAASTSRFGDLRQGAAGSYSQGELRRLWTGENCYEFEARQVLTRFENYEPGTVNEFTKAQQAALTDKLLAVVETATLAGDVAVEWPLAKRSSLRAYVRLSSPAPEASLRSPLAISGQAVGPWFFEASFPVELVTTGGTVLASHYVMADGNWMTADFVLFEGELPFQVSEPTEGFLVLRRANPSGLPQHDAAVRVPLTLLPSPE